jgi:hypothetical protein
MHLVFGIIGSELQRSGFTSPKRTLVNDQSKKCRTCRRDKPLSEFNKNNAKQDGLQAKCRACEKVYYYANHERILSRRRGWNKINKAHKRKYATENRTTLLEQARRWQGLPKPTRADPGFCELCGRPPKKRNLCLDHCHETGQFRGWLCHKCNLGIAALGDSREGLERALAYIDLA